MAVHSRRNCSKFSFVKGSKYELRLVASWASEMRALRWSCFLYEWLRPTRSCLCYNSTTPFALHLRALEPSSIMRVCFSVSRSAAAVAFGRLVRESSASNRCGSLNTLRVRLLLAKLNVVLKTPPRYITLYFEYHSVVLKTYFFYFYTRIQWISISFLFPGHRTSCIYNIR